MDVYSVSTYNNRTIVISTEKGTWTVELADIRAIHSAQSTGYLDTVHSVVILLKNSERVAITTKLADSLEKLISSLKAIWVSWLARGTALENSSRPPVITLINPKTLTVVWGNCTGIIDVPSLTAVRLENKLCRVYLEGKEDIVFTSSNDNYLTQLRDSILYELKSKEKK